MLALAALQPATVLSVGDGDTLRLRQGASRRAGNCWPWRRLALR